MIVLKLMTVAVLLSLCGCASASPLDIFIPTREGKVTPKYLGEMDYTNHVNMMYHSLADTKAERELIKARKMYLEGLRLSAIGETDTIDAQGTMISNGIWIGGSAVLAALGILTPKPGTKAKIQAAGHMTPDDFKSGALNGSA